MDGIILLQGTAWRRKREQFILPSRGRRGKGLRGRALVSISTTIAYITA